MCKVQFGSKRKRRKDHLHTGRLPLFGQGGATVSLTTRLSARDQGGFVFKGSIVEAISETLVRRDLLGNLQLRWHL